MVILGIESSCDETAASILRRHPDGQVDLRSSIISSQDKEHAPFGGVVPEIAARAHMLKLDRIIDQAVNQSGLNYEDIDAVAATAGPGLIGGVIAGLMGAKGLAMSLGKPLIAVNHLEGHALSPRLSEDCPFPYLLLLISGGHSQLLSVTGLGQYTRLGSTVDDAAGEAFDKTAKVMGLGFPGGPNVERWAKKGDPTAIALPRPFKGKSHADFSFAGLKTAVARAWERSDKSDTAKADLAASFQRAVADVLADRSLRAMQMFKQTAKNEPHRFVVAGGVAANTELRARLEQLCDENDFILKAPPLKFCGDNAAMIALVGAEKLALGQTDDMGVAARPRWPLDQTAAQQAPKSGHGKKGPKS
ncbi:MAG: tRNA (adenosine(37)-N6)-threonylcarbamoyltransferase complex transferase subunit TsaD [Litorimonas sp.]